MILYFSATGNCKYVATKIASSMGDEIVSIVDCIKENKYKFSDKKIGIISPTYFWGLPSIVKEFLEKATINSDYIYFVATYGTTPGATGKMASRALKGSVIDAYYSIKMVDTWTPIFDLSTSYKVAKFTKNTEGEIEDVILSIKKDKKNTKMKPSAPLMIADTIALLIYNKKVRKTSNFKVEDSCVGCGICSKKCPVQTIEMRYKKPVWVKEKCVMCLGCLHRCPKFSIQYRDKTKNHGQYVNPHVKL